MISLMFLFPAAMISALSAFTSQNIGAQKNERAVLAVKYGIIMTLAFGVLCCGLSQIISEPMSSWFSKDPLVIRSAGLYLRTYSIDCIIVAFSFCLNGYFCSINKSIVVLVHNAISSFCVRIPLVMLLNKLFPESMLPMGLASPIGSLVSLVICGIYLLILRKKKSEKKPQGVSERKESFYDEYNQKADESITESSTGRA